MFGALSRTFDALLALVMGVVLAGGTGGHILSGPRDAGDWFGSVATVGLGVGLAWWGARRLVGRARARGSAGRTVSARIVAVEPVENAEQEPKASMIADIVSSVARDLVSRSFATVRYVYVDESGISHEGSSDAMTTAEAERWQEIGAVPIRYDPIQPEISVWAGDVGDAEETQRRESDSDTDAATRDPMS